MFSFEHKKLLLEKLEKSFESDLTALVDSAQSAYEAATHAESKADNKYDTRGLEASYLAGAQAQRAAEIRKLLGICSQITIRPFSEDDEISITALVQLEAEGKKQWVFLVPFAGGRSVEIEGARVSIVSSASPLGEELMGREVGDDFDVAMKDREIEYRILQVI
jgi:transcription elongation GreA/GreB family factor